MILLKEEENKMELDFNFWSDFFNVKLEMFGFLIRDCRLFKITDDEQYFYSQSLIERVNIRIWVGMKSIWREKKMVIILQKIIAILKNCVKNMV